MAPASADTGATKLSRLPVNILMTMDCESAKVDVSDHGIRMSSSGPANYEESERSIRGFVETIKAAGYPATLFLHPEVAIAHVDLVRELQASGACLGLHLHPYKLADSTTNRIWEPTQSINSGPFSKERLKLGRVHWESGRNTSVQGISQQTTAHSESWQSLVSVEAVYLTRGAFSRHISASGETLTLTRTEPIAHFGWSRVTATSSKCRFPWPMAVPLRKDMLGRKATSGPIYRTPTTMRL